MRTSHFHTYLGDYRIKILVCVAAALALLLSTVKLWPVPNHDESDGYVYRASERDVIEIEEIQPTQQTDSRPPPPSPPIPILVPDDLVLEDQELEFSENLLDIEDPSEALDQSDGNESENVAQRRGPTVGPKTVRFVEPEYTREARRNRIRAELVVSVVINERGQVTNAEIIERFLLDKDGASKTPVNVLGYGLEEAALSAADRWVFRPARQNGEPVASRTTLTFTFGIDA